MGLTSKHQLNLPKLLDRLDMRDYTLYDVLSADEADRKEFERLLGFLLPSYMAGAKNDTDHAALVREWSSIDINWRGLGKHPALRAKLLASMGLGKRVRHHLDLYSKSSVSALVEFLNTVYPGIRMTEIRSWCRRNSEADLIELATRRGIQKEDLAKLVNEYGRFVVEQT